MSLPTCFSNLELKRLKKKKEQEQEEQEEQEQEEEDEEEEEEEASDPLLSIQVRSQCLPPAIKKRRGPGKKELKNLLN